MRVYLNGNEYPLEEIEGIDQIKITMRFKDENGQTAKGFSGELTFSGSAYELFKTNILDNPNGENEHIDITFIEDCCDDFELFRGEIKGRDVRWCELVCRVTTNPVQKVESLDCLRSTLIAESNKTVKNATPTGFISQLHPQVSYCLEYRPSFLQDIVLIIGIILNIILYILYPIVAIISLIISIICSAASVLDVSCPDDLANGILDDYQRFIDFLNDALVGCGRKHPSPLLRDYINNVCTICGLDFRSSILNDPKSPYYNTVYFNASYKKGLDVGEGTDMIDENIPLTTLDRFLNDTLSAYNSEWRLIGNTVVVERKDYFEKLDVWLDFSKIDVTRITKQCYEFAKDDLFAFGNFEYTLDGIDWVGDEAKTYYDAIAEWNSPPNLIQKAEDHVQLLFGRSRFRDDNIDIDILGRPIYNIPIVPFYAILQRNKFDLLLNNGTAIQPKLLIWDGKDRSNAKIKRFGGAGLGDNNGFNYPYVFEVKSAETPAVYAGDKLQMTPEKNLYHNFYQINNPRLMAFRRRDFTLEFNYLCEDLLTADPLKTIIISFGGVPTQATIDTIEITPHEHKMSITGRV